jgi:hypothetical protein
MYTKHIFIVIAILLIGFTANSQTDERTKPLQMSMFANVGTKILNFENLESNNIFLPKTAFNLGAGAYWSLKKILWSSDFYYSQAKSKNNGSLTEYNAFTNTFYVSYKVIDTYTITFAPLVGMAMTTNKISVYDDNFSGDILDNSYNSYTLKHHDNAIRVGLNFEAIVYLHNTIGVVLGYDYSLNKNAEWKVNGADMNAGISDNFSGFFINLTIGSRIPLTKNH